MLGWMEIDSAALRHNFGVFADIAGRDKIAPVVKSNAYGHGLQQVYVHVIFDGRSTEPGSAPDLLKKFEAQIEEIGVGQIVTGVGRGIALDRDGNYAKTQRAFDALVSGTGTKVVLA